jgi:hypothetical protein
MPFEFLMDYLPGDTIVVPAIGMYYMYTNGKNILIFRKTGKNPQHNGIWISTKREHHTSLKAEIPTITDFTFDHSTDTDWLLLSDTHEDLNPPRYVFVNWWPGKIKRLARLPLKANRFKIIIVRGRCYSEAGVCRACKCSPSNDIKSRCKHSLLCSHTISVCEQWKYSILANLCPINV